MSYAGRLPERDVIRTTDIYCRREWSGQKGVPILLDRYGEPFSQYEATRFLRRALVEIGYLTVEEAACYCLRSLRLGYLSYLHARNFELGVIARVAAHTSTKTTSTYVKDAAGKRLLKRKSSKGRSSNQVGLSAYLEKLPTVKIAKNSGEAFNFMHKVAQNYLKSGKEQDIVRRTDNASKDLSRNPFRHPKSWRKKWSFQTKSDRKRHGILPKARTWSNNREKTRGL